MLDISTEVGGLERFTRRRRISFAGAFEFCYGVSWDEQTVTRGQPC
jgi:hypothetical protein